MSITSSVLKIYYLNIFVYSTIFVKTWLYKIQNLTYKNFWTYINSCSLSVETIQILEISFFNLYFRRVFFSCSDLPQYSFKSFGNSLSVNSRLMNLLIIQLKDTKYKRMTQKRIGSVKFVRYRNINPYREFSSYIIYDDIQAIFVYQGFLPAF